MAGRYSKWFIVAFSTSAGKMYLLVQRLWHLLGTERVGKKGNVRETQTVITATNVRMWGKFTSVKSTTRTCNVFLAAFFHLLLSPHSSLVLYRMAARICLFLHIDSSTDHYPINWSLILDHVSKCLHKSHKPDGWCHKKTCCFVIQCRLQSRDILLSANSNMSLKNVWLHSRSIRLFHHHFWFRRSRLKQHRWSLNYQQCIHSMSDTLLRGTSHPPLWNNQNCVVTCGQLNTL